MIDRKIPINIPKTNIRKYELAYDKGYNEYFVTIYKLGSYITFKQFYKIYSKLNPTLSYEYIKRKGNNIIKDMTENKFIEVDVLGKHKYFYLKAPALAFAVGDYNKIPKLNHKSRSSNNSKITSSLLRVEYYILTNEYIEYDTIYLHLKTITKNILQYTLKYNLDYNTNFLNSIINSSDYDKIQLAVENLEKDNLIYIIWINLFNMFLKLRKQGQTISPKPLHFKLYLYNKQLKLHYVPEIILLDTHKVDYYGTKMDRLLSDLVSIKSNTIYNLSTSFQPNQPLGDSKVNILGYGLKIIGSDQKALISKAEFIKTYGTANINSPFCDVSTVYLDLSTYFNYSYRKTDVVDKIDNQIEDLLKTTLERVYSMNSYT